MSSCDNGTAVDEKADKEYAAQLTSAIRRCRTCESVLCDSCLRLPCAECGRLNAVDSADAGDEDNDTESGEDEECSKFLENFIIINPAYIWDSI